MSYKRKPVYQFKDTTETGIDTIPLNRLVFIENTNVIYIKDNNTSLTDTSTIQDAISGGNLLSFVDSVINVDANYTAKNESAFLVLDTSGADLATGVTKFTVTLPEGALDGTILRIIDGGGQSSSVPILISHTSGASTYNIDNVEDDLTCDVDYFDIKLIYNNAINNWALGGK